MDPGSASGTRWSAISVALRKNRRTSPRPSADVTKPLSFDLSRQKSIGHGLAWAAATLPTLDLFGAHQSRRVFLGQPGAVSQVSLFGERYAAFSSHDDVV